jgi:NAD(P)-dependent dehydrogenase (short-subunit alcohol dehydrogenase family)
MVWRVDGQVVLITGATDGLGRALARAADAAGAVVLVHGRSDERIQDTLSELSDRARGYRADLASLAEVRRLAGEVLAAEPRLDVLVNNAGIGTNVPAGGARQESADGRELRFAVNYLAGYALTRRLLDLLRRSAPARIVNVSSAGQAPIDFDDVMLERHYDGVQAYCQSEQGGLPPTAPCHEQRANRPLPPPARWAAVAACRYRWAPSRG